MFQVGIVGAGPAGSTCAQVLGKAGFSVAIFDHSYPRQKPCGGLVENRVVEEFKIPTSLLENEVKWSLAERFGFRTKVLFDPSHFLVTRRDLDQYLLQRALENKSVTFFKEKVTDVVQKGNWLLRTNAGRHVEVKVLVGADGCPSSIRNQVFKPIPQEFLSMTVGYDFSCPPEYVEKNFPKKTIEAYYSNKYVKKQGFIWIFPKKITINVGMGSRATGRNLKKNMDDFIQSHPAGKRLKNLSGQFYAHLIPVIPTEKFFDLPCAGNNWALIGDAAGHVNPISGVGITYAMKGGLLCGSALLDGDVHLFEERWREEYGDELYFAAKTFSRFYGRSGFLIWMGTILQNFLAAHGRQ